MKYLMIGIWHGDNPGTVHRKTPLEMEPADAAADLKENSDGRPDVPDRVLIVGYRRIAGPYVRYDWRKGLQYQALT